MPVDAETWSDEHLRMVLTHELVHVRRHDPATMVLVELVCALHWFNPLVWLCAARVRREGECACDDAVLRSGTDATRYATLLLNVARLTAARHRAWVTAPAIAHPSTLEGRIAAMLNRQRNRAPVTRLAKALVAIIAGAIVIPLAAAGIAPSTSPDPVAAVERGDVSLAPVQTVRGEPTLSDAAPATVVADRQSAGERDTGSAVEAALRWSNGFVSRTERREPLPRLPSPLRRWPSPQYKRRGTLPAPPLTRQEGSCPALE